MGKNSSKCADASAAAAASSNTNNAVCDWYGIIEVWQFEQAHWKKTRFVLPMGLDVSNSRCEFVNKQNENHVYLCAKGIIENGKRNESMDNESWTSVTSEQEHETDSSLSTAAPAPDAEVHIDLPKEWDRIVMKVCFAPLATAMTGKVPTKQEVAHSSVNSVDVREAHTHGQNEYLLLPITRDLSVPETGCSNDVKVQLHWKNEEEGTGHYVLKNLFCRLTQAVVSCHCPCDAVSKLATRLSASSCQVFHSCDLASETFSFKVVPNESTSSTAASSAVSSPTSARPALVSAATAATAEEPQPNHSRKNSGSSTDSSNKSSSKLSPHRVSFALKEHSYSTSTEVH